MDVKYEKCRNECEHYCICKYVYKIKQIEEQAEILNTYEVSDILAKVNFNCDHYSKADSDDF